MRLVIAFLASLSTAGVALVIAMTLVAAIGCGTGAQPGTASTGTTTGIASTSGGSGTSTGTTTGSSGGSNGSSTTGGCLSDQCVFNDGTCGWNLAGTGPCGLSSANGNLNCCAGLTCESDNTCEPAVSTTGGSAGCGFDAGAPCVTNADCLTGLCSITASQAQTGPSSSGVCQEPSTPTSFGQCGAFGTSCGGPTDAPCCGFCGSDSPTRLCHDLPHACGLSLAPCTSDDDCCANFACLNSTCTATCGQVLAACDPAHNNSDCCTTLGFVCTPTVMDGGISTTQSVYGADLCNRQLSGSVIQNSTAVCQPPTTSTACGDAGECLLGSPCIPGAGLCGPAGLLCDATNFTCRYPQWFESCSPAGPPCDFGDNSKDNSYVCEDPGGTTGTPYCNELCHTSNDCLNALAQCYAFAAPISQSLCLFLSQTTNGGIGCTNYFGTCNAESTNDGICIQTLPGQGQCLQALLDGGATGTACQDNANRQNAHFCDLTDYCTGNICDPLCDPSGIGPGCPSTAACVGVSGNNPETYGVCVTFCNFLAADGGGCPAEQKCALPYLFGLPDGLTGGCIGLAPNAGTLGQHCIPNFPDPCGIGQTCEGDAFDGFMCHQSCSNPGGTCADGTPCNGYALSTGNSQSQGYCTGTSLWDAGS